MVSPLSIEQVEKLVAQLPPREQLKLAAGICEQLSISPPATPSEDSTEEQVEQERLTRLDAWLDECEKVAALWEGEFDSAADLRRIREEET